MSHNGYPSATAHTCPGSGLQRVVQPSSIAASACRMADSSHGHSCNLCHVTASCPPITLLPCTASTSHKVIQVWHAVFCMQYFACEASRCGMDISRRSAAKLSLCQACAARVRACALIDAAVQVCIARRQRLQAVLGRARGGRVLGRALLRARVRRLISRRRQRGCRGARLRDWPRMAWHRVRLRQHACSKPQRLQQLSAVTACCGPDAPTPLPIAATLSSWFGSATTGGRCSSMPPAMT